MKDKKIDGIINIIADLAEVDNHHLLLEPYEVAALRIVRTTGSLSYNMLSPENISSNDEVMVEYANIQPHLMQLYIDMVLVIGHSGHTKFSDINFNGRISNIKETFGLELISLLHSTVSVLLEGLTTDSKFMFTSSTKLLHAFIFSVLDLYNVDEDDFYLDVEAYAYELLSKEAKNHVSMSAYKLKSQFKGKHSVTISAKIDKRHRTPFLGFRITVKEHPTILFSGKNPYKVFLDASRYINEETEFKDIRIHIDIKTKVFLNMYNIMFIKENLLTDKMAAGFYPVLVPKGVSNIEEFLDVLT